MASYQAADRLKNEIALKMLKQEMFKLLKGKN